MERALVFHLIHDQLKSLGGSITLESQLDKGATFRIIFPKDV